MSEELDLVYRAVEDQHVEKSAATRRQLVAGAAATLGGLGFLGLPSIASAQDAGAATDDPQTILNVAATAEVLATIVNTVGAERVRLDRVTRRNVRAAAREELVHYKVLTSEAVGGKEITKRIWVPDAVFASPKNLLSTLEVGDQIFVNAYLIATTVFCQKVSADLARIAAEFMGVEAVHRALARQSLGKLGNDRVFMKYNQRESAPDAPNRGTPGFTRIGKAVEQLQAAGFGFGAEGATPGRFYHFDKVRQRTPSDPDLNTYSPA